MTPGWNHCFCPGMLVTLLSRPNMFLVLTDTISWHSHRTTNHRFLYRLLYRLFRPICTSVTSPLLTIDSPLIPSSHWWWIYLVSHLIFVGFFHFHEYFSFFLKQIHGFAQLGSQVPYPRENSVLVLFIDSSLVFSGICIILWAVQLLWNIPFLPPALTFPSHKAVISFGDTTPPHGSFSHRLCF